MKKYILLIAIFFVARLSITHAQVKKDTADYPYYIDMMQDESVNFYTVQSAFNKYYAKHHIEDKDNDRKINGENEENDGFAFYKRWEYMTRRRIKADGSRVPSDQVSKEIEKYKLTHPDR
jgi:hypothetical protein